MYTKNQVKSDWQYARWLMRQAAPLLTENDLDGLAEIASELIAAAASLSAYLEERGL